MLLNAGTPTVDFTVVAGTSGVIGATGPFGGGEIDLSFALPATPTEFAPIEGGQFTQAFAKDIKFPGTKIRATLNNPDRTGTSAVNIECTATP